MSENKDSSDTGDLEKNKKFAQHSLADSEQRAIENHQNLSGQIQHYRDRRRFQDTLPEYEIVEKYHDRLLERSQQRSKRSHDELRRGFEEIVGQPIPEARPEEPLEELLPKPTSSKSRVPGFLRRIGRALRGSR
jgi:hypothetical protein